MMYTLTIVRESGEVMILRSYNRKRVFQEAALETGFMYYRLSYRPVCK